MNFTLSVIPILSIILSLVLVGITVWRKTFVMFLPLVLYVLTCTTFGTGAYVVSHRNRPLTTDYFLEYYTWDLLLSILGYVVLSWLTYKLLPAPATGPLGPRLIAILVFLGVLYSALLITSGPTLFSRRAYQLEVLVSVSAVVFCLIVWWIVRATKNRPRVLLNILCGLAVMYGTTVTSYAPRLFRGSAIADPLNLIHALGYVASLCIWLYAVAHQPHRAR